MTLITGRRPVTTVPDVEHCIGMMWDEDIHEYVSLQWRYSLTLAQTLTLTLIVTRTLTVTRTLIYEYVSLRWRYSSLEDHFLTSH